MAESHNHDNGMDRPRDDELAVLATTRALDRLTPDEESALASATAVTAVTGGVDQVAAPEQARRIASVLVDAIMSSAIPAASAELHSAIDAELDRAAAGAAEQPAGAGRARARRRNWLSYVAAAMIAAVLAGLLLPARQMRRHRDVAHKAVGQWPSGRSNEPSDAASPEPTGSLSTLQSPKESEWEFVPSSTRDPATESGGAVPANDKFAMPGQAQPEPEGQGYVYGSGYGGGEFGASSRGRGRGIAGAKPPGAMPGDAITPDMGGMPGAAMPGDASMMSGMMGGMSAGAGMPHRSLPQMSGGMSGNPGMPGMMPGADAGAAYSGMPPYGGYGMGMGPFGADNWHFTGGYPGETYIPIQENPFKTVQQEPLSSFSIDVDTAAYANVRRFLASGHWPPQDAVRIEELLNYFSYDYPQPRENDPFSVNMEVAECPWRPENWLLRIGLKGRDVPSPQRAPSNLVFLVDVSGSMQPENKLPLIKTALSLLVRELTENDHVSIVTYAGDAGLKLPATNGMEKGRILSTLDSLSAGGSTHGSAGIELAYQQATGHFIPGGTNRVILLTDGDLNVGITDDDALVQLIERKAKSGVFLTVLGVGDGNLKDSKMEQLADHGNGIYAYLDGVREAHKVLVTQPGHHRQGCKTAAGIQPRPRARLSTDRVRKPSAGASRLSRRWQGRGRDWRGAYRNRHV
jgi:uncharacterized protein YegL